MAMGFVVLSVYGYVEQTGESRLSVDVEKLIISKVERGPFQEYIPVRGSVMPIRTVYLEALEGGRIEEIYLEEGAEVCKGDSILRMMNSDLHLEVIREEARLDEQVDQLHNTRLDMEQKLLQFKRDLLERDYEIQKLERLHNINARLAETGIISKQEYEDITAEYKHAIDRQVMTIQYQAQDSLLMSRRIEQQAGWVERVGRDIQIVRRRLDDLTLRAPLAGQLTVLDAEIGQSLARSERLGQIDVLDRFKVRAEIVEHYIARISRGLRASFDLAGETYGLVLQKVYPQVREGRFAVDFNFDEDSPKGVRRGQTVHMRLVLGDPEELLMVARGGFFQSTGGRWVYVLNETGDRAVKRAIRVGRQNADVFEVLDGLDAGEQAITSSYDNFGNDIDVLLLK